MDRHNYSNLVANDSGASDQSDSTIHSENRTNSVEMIDSLIEAPIPDRDFQAQTSSSRNRTTTSEVPQEEHLSTTRTQKKGGLRRNRSQSRPASSRARARTRSQSSSKKSTKSDRGRKK